MCCDYLNQTGLLLAWDIKGVAADVIRELFPAMDRGLVTVTAETEYYADSESEIVINPGHTRGHRDQARRRPG